MSRDSIKQELKHEAKAWGWALAIGGILGGSAGLGAGVYFGASLTMMGVLGGAGAVVGAIGVLVFYLYATSLPL